MRRLTTMVVMLSAGLAAAEGQSWSAVGARTVEPGGNQLALSAGWPGISVDYLRGAVSGLNLGARASFTYGVEGLVRQAMPGLELRGLVKVRLVDTDRLSLGLVFEPGPFFAFPSQPPNRVGLALPVGLRLGISPSSAFALSVRLDVPMWVEFGSSATSGFYVPILTGLGVEYFATSTLAVFARLELGPTIKPSSLAELTLDGAVGVAFHL